MKNHVCVNPQNIVRLMLDFTVNCQNVGPIPQFSRRFIPQPVELLIEIYVGPEKRAAFGALFP